MVTIAKALGIFGTLLIIASIWTYPSDFMWIKLLWTGMVVGTVGIGMWLWETDA